MQVGNGVDRNEIPIMHSTELINYVISFCAASLPVVYLFCVARGINSDLQHTDQIAEQPGQTHNTAIIDLHAKDGHTAHAAGKDLHHEGLAFAH